LTAESTFWVQTLNEPELLTAGVESYTGWEEHDSPREAKGSSPSSVPMLGGGGGKAAASVTPTAVVGKQAIRGRPKVDALLLQPPPLEILLTKLHGVVHRRGAGEEPMLLQE